MPKLAEKEYCTGCTACASACPMGCIAMTADENGFLCPVIDPEKCVECGLCEKSCPVLIPLGTTTALLRAYAAYTKDEAIRLDSSSGGVFTEIARTVLEDGGAVFGAAYNERFEVGHICVETERDLAGLRGAKYAQSDLRGVFTQVKECLDRGRQVLFSGTPCQVGGLIAYLRKPYENLLTVDFVCHSVPSPMAWQAYIKYRSQQDNGGELPERINLRSKETGWSQYQYSNLFEYADGKKHTARSGESLYMKLFVGGYISRESCANCQFKGYRRISDLTIGDFWGIWDVAPEMDDNKGTSVVLIQSERGAEVMEHLKDKLAQKPVTLEEASQQNSAMLTPMAAKDKRSEALECIRAGKFPYCEKWFVSSKLTIAQKARGIVKRILRRGFSK